jgi:hypothetical protein
MLPHEPSVAPRRGAISLSLARREQARVGAPLLPIHSTSIARWQLATDSLSAALKTCLRVRAESSVALRG